MNHRIIAFAILLVFSVSHAGEIVIIQPAGNETRSEKNSARTAERARQNSGKQAGPIIVEDGSVNMGSNAVRSSRDAQDYLNPAGSQTPGDNTTIIMRSAPLSDSEKARQKAASYVQPSSSSATNRACGDVSLSVGTVGDKMVVDRNITVNERGNSAVNVNCRR
ncbi:MAG: hypothetical protein WCL27_16125 [Betaproteobacteria bacterium]